MSETFSPVHMRWLSPSADDVMPMCLHAAYDKEPYLGEANGSGRIHDLVDPSKTPVGRLWTKNTDGARLMAAPNGNPVYQAQIALLLREMNRQGFPQARRSTWSATCMPSTRSIPATMAPRTIRSQTTPTIDANRPDESRG